MGDTSEEHKWFKIDNGVEAMRFVANQTEVCRIEVLPHQMIWAVCLEGKVSADSNMNSRKQLLNVSDAAMFVWPRSPWVFVLDSGRSSVTAIFRITLEALHHMMSVDYDDQQAGSTRFDTSNLARVVHFSPVRLQQLGRLFIHSHDSMFRSVSRKGIFYDIFAEFLEGLYGNDTDKCPFQIDADTERKIRKAHQLLISDLRTLPDLADLANQVELPKQVLREGFTFLYGHSIADYQVDYKFEKARTMIEGGKFLIKEIAFQMGYQNPSHFISAFKQKYGATPKQWAKQNVVT